MFGATSVPSASPPGDRQHSFHSRQVRRVGTVGAQPAPHGSPGKRERSKPEGGGIGRIQLISQRAEEISVLCCKRCQAGEQGNDVSAHELRAERDQLVAHPVAQDRRVHVRRILERLESCPAGHLSRVGASDPEHRVLGSRPHRAKPVRTGSSQQPDHHSLCLIVHRVSGGRAGREYRSARHRGRVPRGWDLVRPPL